MRKAGAASGRRMRGRTDDGSADATGAGDAGCAPDASQPSAPRARSARATHRGEAGVIARALTVSRASAPAGEAASRSPAAMLRAHEAPPSHPLRGRRGRRRDRRGCWSSMGRGAPPRVAPSSGAPSSDAAIPASAAGATVTPEVTTLPDDDGFRVLVFLVPLAGARFRVLDVGMTGDLSRALEETSASLVVNGGFFLDKAQHAEGLVISEGAVLSPRSATPSAGASWPGSGAGRGMLAAAEGFVAARRGPTSRSRRGRGSSSTARAASSGTTGARPSGPRFACASRGRTLEVVVARGEACRGAGVDVLGAPRRHAGEPRVHGGARTWMVDRRPASPGERRARRAPSRPAGRCGTPSPCGGTGDGGVRRGPRPFPSPGARVRMARPCNFASSACGARSRHRAARRCATAATPCASRRGSPMGRW